MNIEQFRNYCMAKQGVSEHFPFDENVLVFKVADKMFSLTNLRSEDFVVNLKCDPEWAIDLREMHEGVLPGYHMNKKHWNSVNVLDPGISTKLLKEMIDHSYLQVVSKLSKKVREAFQINLPSNKG